MRHLLAHSRLRLRIARAAAHRSINYGIYAARHTAAQRPRRRKWGLTAILQDFRNGFFTMKGAKWEIQTQKGSIWGSLGSFSGCSSSSCNHCRIFEPPFLELLSELRGDPGIDSRGLGALEQESGTLRVHCGRVAALWQS